MEQRVAGKKLDIEIATRVMGVSLDMPRERALSMIGATFTRETGRVFEVDYGDGREYLPMPAGDSLPSYPSDDSFNQRYFRYVAEQGIEAGGKRAEMIERLVAQCRLTPEPYSTDIAAAMLVIVEVLRKHPDWTFSLDGGDASHIHIGGIPGPSDYTGIGWRAEFSIPPDASTRFGHPRYREFAPTAPLAVCLAALAAALVQFEMKNRNLDNVDCGRSFARWARRRKRPGYVPTFPRRKRRQRRPQQASSPQLEQNGASRCSEAP